MTNKTNTLEKLLAIAPGTVDVDYSGDGGTFGLYAVPNGQWFYFVSQGNFEREVENDFLYAPYDESYVTMIRIAHYDGVVPEGDLTEWLGEEDTDGDKWKWVEVITSNYTKALELVKLLLTKVA